MASERILCKFSPPKEFGGGRNPRERSLSTAPTDQRTMVRWGVC